MDREQVLTDQTVVIQDGRITALGPADRVRVPAKAVQIDGRGKFLLPRLMDAKNYLQLSEAAHIEHTLFLLLANGIITVRSSIARMAGDSANNGQIVLDGPSLLRLRARAAAGELPTRWCWRATAGSMG